MAKRVDKAETALTELDVQFDREFAKMNKPGAHAKIDAAMATRRKVTPRPKAGTAIE